MPFRLPMKPMMPPVAAPPLGEALTAAGEHFEDSEWARDLAHHTTAQVMKEDQLEPSPEKAPSLGRAIALGLGSGATLGALDSLRGAASAAAGGPGLYSAPAPVTDTQARMAGQTLIPPTPRQLASAYPGMSYTDAYTRWYAENRPDVQSAAFAERQRQGQEAAYHEFRNRAREESELAEAAHPRAYGISEVAGAMGTGLLVPGAAEQKGAGLAQRLWSNARSAAKWGLGYGLAEAPEIEDIPRQVAHSGGANVALSTLFGLAGPGVAKLGKFGTRVIGPKLEQLVANRAEAAKLAQAAKEAGGFTFSPATKKYVTKGYALSTSPDKGVILPDIGGKSLADYMNRHEPTFMRDPTAVAGGWRNPATGKWEIDVSKVLQDREEAIRQAQAAHQKAIFDLGAGETIPVPAAPGALTAGSERSAAFVPESALRWRAPRTSPEEMAEWEIEAMRRQGPPVGAGSHLSDELARQRLQAILDAPANPPPTPFYESLMKAYQKARLPFANGGEVPKMADGGWTPDMMSSHGNAPAPMLTPQPMAAPGAVDSAALLSQQQVADQAGAPAAQSEALARLYAALPPAAASLPVGDAVALLQRQRAAAGAPPPQGQQGVDPFAGILGMMQPPTGAVMAVGKAQQQQALNEAALADKQAAWQQEQMRWYTDARDKIDADYNATVQDYQNSHIDPNRVFHDKTTGQKALAMIGLLLGGIGSGITGQPSMAAQMIQNQIERDVQAQAAEMDKKKNLVAMNYQRYGNLEAAMRMTAMQQMAYYESRLHQLTATSNAAQAMPNAQLAAFELRKPLIPMMMQLAQYQGLQNMIRSGGHVVGDQPAPWTWEQYMETAMPGPNGTTTFARSADARKTAVDGLQKWDAYADAVDNLAAVAGNGPRMPFTDAAHAYDQARERVILALANAQNVGKGEALKLVENMVPTNFERFFHGAESLDALRQLGANGKWAIWETQGSLHNPRLPAYKSGAGPTAPAPSAPRYTGPSLFNPPRPESASSPFEGALRTMPRGR